MLADKRLYYAKQSDVTDLRQRRDSGAGKVRPVHSSRQPLGPFVLASYGRRAEIVVRKCTPPRFSLPPGRQPHNPSHPVKRIISRPQPQRQRTRAPLPTICFYQPVSSPILPAEASKAHAIAGAMDKLQSQVIQTLINRAMRSSLSRQISDTDAFYADAKADCARF